MQLMLSMLIFPTFGEICPCGVGIGGIIWCVSEFLQVVYTKPLDICYDFSAFFNLNF